ncbi:MAG TPA: substrate-binding domain-containing protein [Pirellulales bacterium]|nr:substrate-binding domain-containing protein [Pirellulales bacterium]
MSSTHPPQNAVRAQRIAKGWSQQQLADRTGLSRAGISAVESGRLAPSVTAALALSRVLGSSVEELFAPPAAAAESAVAWAVEPQAPQPRFWQARVGSHLFAYPVGEDTPQPDWHDGVFRGAFRGTPPEIAERTLVIAGCDPAAGFLATEYARQFHFRLIVLRRSSRDALDLLSAGKVHAAGLHLGRPGARSENAKIARLRLGKDCRLVHLARWEEGLALGSRLTVSSVQSVARSDAHWVGREAGSGARQCQDEILAGKPAPRRIAYDHRAVAAAVKCGWADVGPCVRLASEESGLRFLKISDKDYDLCFPVELEHDPRIAALLATLRSRAYRARLSELPGYSTRHTGELA